MAEPARERLTELAELPRSGSPERREWDRTIRQANELYPDWASIRIGQARFAREAYEQYRQAHLSEASRRSHPRPRRTREPDALESLS